MTVRCARCQLLVAAEPDGRLRPWCPGCGADLKDAVAWADPSSSSSTSASAADPIGRDDKFQMHNMLMGMLLAVWGGLIATLAHDGTTAADRLIAQQKSLNQTINMLQVVTMVTGVALFVSGIGIRAGKPWGYGLAFVCAVVALAGGGLFFFGVSQLGRGPGMEAGVAQITFLRTNLDLVIGFVDGLFLLFLLAGFSASVRRS